jgi:hypothetical protein
MHPHLLKALGGYDCEGPFESESRPASRSSKPNALLGEQLNVLNH